MNDTKSYAGYITINKLCNSNTFFWFFPSQNDSRNDPLLIWMSGGPGSSSLVALLAENGPFYITENQTLEMRKYSWHTNHNIIYIDNPVGINLKGLAIGNGMTDPINQMNRSDYLYNLGIFDSHDREEMRIVEDKVRLLIRQKKYLESTLAFDTLFTGEYTGVPSLFTKLSGFTYIFNYLQTQRPEEVNRFITWVEKTEARKALHVGNVDFIHRNKVVRKHLIEDINQSVAYLVADLLHDYKVLLYNGQLDIAVPYTSTEEYLRNLNWTGAEDFKTSKRKQWKVENEIAGYSKTVGNLTFILVRNAGHFVPTDQPLWAWDMITRFTHSNGF